jgi:DNA invertase Pin-like site-specific DNA recombinase
MTIEGQIRICTEFAQSRGLNVIKIYPEKAKSASKDTHKRKAFQQMLHDAESGAFQYIIVYKFDRFARNRFESMMLKHQLKEKCGVKVLSALEPVTDDEGGELYEMFVEWNDEKYSQRLSVRIRDGLTTSVENGTFTGSKLIYGYKLIDTDRTGKKGTIHKVAIDEEQAETVRFIFTEYAKGTEKKDIASALNANGLRFNGKPFRGRTFDKWLTNAKYTGEFMFGDRLCNTIYPPIIDKLLFAEVQKRLAKNKILAGANSAVEPYLLTGKVYCGHCGAAIVADGGTSQNGTKHYYYACKQKKKGLCHKAREKKDLLEMQVTQAVKDFLSDKKNADRAASDTIAHYEQRTGDSGLRSIDTRIAQAKQEVENLTNAFIEAKSPLLRAGIERKMQDFETLLADLQAQKSQIELERGRKVTKQQILSFVAELIKGDPADKDYQKKIIDNLVLQVFVYDDETIKVASFLNFGVDKSIEKVRLDETNEVIERLKFVQTQSPVVHHSFVKRTRRKVCYIVTDFSFFIAVIKDLVYKSVDERLSVFGFGIIEVFEPFDIIAQIFQLKIKDFRLFDFKLQFDFFTLLFELV